MSWSEKLKQIFVYWQEKMMMLKWLKKYEVTATVSLTCGKNIKTAAEYNENFYETDQSAYQERQ